MSKNEWENICGYVKTTQVDDGSYEKTLYGKGSEARWVFRDVNLSSEYRKALYLYTVAALKYGEDESLYGYDIKTLQEFREEIETLNRLKMVSKDKLDEIKKDEIEMLEQPRGTGYFDLQTKYEKVFQQIRDGEIEELEYSDVIGGTVTANRVFRILQISHPLVRLGEVCEDTREDLKNLKDKIKKELYENKEPWERIKELLDGNARNNTKKALAEFANLMGAVFNENKIV